MEPLKSASLISILKGLSCVYTENSRSNPNYVRKLYTMKKYTVRKSSRTGFPGLPPQSVDYQSIQTHSPCSSNMH